MANKALNAVRVKLQNCVDEIDLSTTRDPKNVTFTIEQLLGVIDKQQEEIESKNRTIQRLRK